MTASQRVFHVVSANELFKSQYGRYMRWSLLVALLLTAVGIWLMPKYEPVPYVQREKVIHIMNIEPIIDLDDLKEEPQTRRLVLPIEPTEEPGVEEYEMPSLGEVWDPRPPMPPGNPDEGFVPSSSKPRLLSQPRPEYPEIMRMAGVEGVVMLKVLVGPDGLVDDIVVLRGVHPVLDRAAVKAARRCRFAPGTQRSIPVRAWVEVPYRFRMH